MAWFANSEARRVYDCEECKERGLERARNCKGEDDESRFMFQIRSIQRKGDKLKAFIYECPSSYVSEFSKIIWQRYNDVKIRKEFGFPNKEPSSLYFKAFQILAHASQDYEEHKRKQEDRAAKIKAKGLKRG